jgi:hypothetical protein
LQQQQLEYSANIYIYQLHGIGCEQILKYYVAKLYLALKKSHKHNILKVNEARSLVLFAHCRTVGGIECKKSKSIPRNVQKSPEKYRKVQKSPEKSRKVQKRSRKVQKSPEKSRKVQKSPEKSRKILEKF